MTDRQQTVRIVCSGQVMRRVEKLVPYRRNAKLHDEAQVNALRRSLREFGFVRPLLIDARDNLIAGHGTLIAAKAEGMTEVPCILAEGLTDEQRRAYILADNKLAELGGWNRELLELELNDLDFDLSLAGFAQCELEELRAADCAGVPDSGDVGGDEREPLEREGDEVPELCKRGDLWRLGKHRLLCGDCTDPADKAHLLGCAAPELLLTDPPYCSGGFQESGRAAGSIGTDAKDRKVANDALSTRGYVSLIKGALRGLPVRYCYLFTDWRMWCSLFDVVEVSGFGVRSMIVWDKGSPGMGFGWRAQHELILFAHNGRPSFDKHFAQGNVISCPRSRNAHHPTEKPLELMRTILRNSMWAEGVCDLFAGSGTTLLACEELGQTCFSMELEPRICDVAISRWEAMTGERAEKL